MMSAPMLHGEQWSPMVDNCMKLHIRTVIIVWYSVVYRPRSKARGISSEQSGRGRYQRNVP